MHIRVNESMNVVYIHVCAYIFANKSVCIYVYMHISIHVLCIRTHVYTYICMYMYVSL